MQHSLEERVIALAAIYQSVKQVQEMARKGSVDSDELLTSLQSILVDNPENTLEVFGNLDKLRSGLNCLIEQLGENSPGRDVELIKYAMGLVHLERQLHKHPTMLNTIGERISDVQRQLEHYAIDHDNVIANLAGIYSDTLSTLPFRIMVSGDPRLLADNSVANKIRALLLAGIRATVLWRQCGGTRWQFIFSRKKTLHCAKNLLQRINH